VSVNLHPDSEKLLADLGTDRGPVSPQELEAARSIAPDPRLAGIPEPVALRSELTLPLEAAPLRAWVYRDDLRARQPILLWLHGGGFCAGTLASTDTTCAAVARRSRLVVVSLEYRLAPEHPFPAALTDVVSAVAWLREHGSELGGDGRVVVGGLSAGGNLAAAATLHTRTEGCPRIDAQVLCYPALDFAQSGESHVRFDGVLFDRANSAWCYEQYLAGQEVTPLASPHLAESLADLPPALVVTAGSDPLRDDGRRYAARLRGDGVPVRELEYEGAIHAFLNFPGALPYAWDAIDDISEFLRRCVPAVRPPASLQHVTILYARDRLEELREFYGTVIGLPEKEVPQSFADSGVVWFDAGDGERELHFVPSDDPEIAVPHLCLETADLSVVAARVEGAGVDVEHSDAIINRPRCFFEDPFGNTIEVVARRGCYA
jgi:acetyl esterase